KETPTARVLTGAGDVRPVAPVAGDIEVDQVLFKECSPQAPVQPQLMNKEAGQPLAHTVGAVAGVQQLAQAGINRRIAGARRAPGPPAAVIQRFRLRVAEHGRALQEQRPVKILAPQQFFFQPAAVLVSVVYGLPALNAGPYLPDG